MRFATAIGAYEIDSAPGQPQVAHCHGFFVRADLRGQGFAHKQKADQNITLIALKYDYAMCTVCSNNIAQKRVLERAGWSRTGEFLSSKSGALVEVWGWEVQRTGSSKNGCGKYLHALDVECHHDLDDATGRE